MNMFISISAFCLATVQLIFLANFFISIFAGKRVTENNPWHATTLEWETPCPTGTWKLRRRAAGRASLGL